MPGADFCRTSNPITNATSPLVDITFEVNYSTVTKLVDVKKCLGHETSFDVKLF